MKAVDMTGKKYNKLTALHIDSARKGYWFFECECGVIKSIKSASVRSALTKSCGCSQHLKNKEAISKHPLYVTHRGMISRCTDPKNDHWVDYGGRGINVCDRWLKSFENFLNDMGEKPSPKHTLDRVDNDKGYSPENCRWATKAEQARNTRKNIFLTYNGETKRLTEWADIYGITPRMLWRRLYESNLPIEVALDSQSLKTKLVEYKGETKHLAEWCRVLGLNESFIQWRLRNSWSVEKAFETPSKKAKHNENLSA